MENCIFCAILEGQAAGSFVYRDERVAAFLDIHPVNPGHLLVLPVRHAANLAELDPEDGAHLFRVGQRLAGALPASGIRCEGVNLFLADGAVAGQEVFHAHLHVLPRWPGDGFGFRFGPRYGQVAPREELEGQAERIRRELQGLD